MIAKVLVLLQEKKYALARQAVLEMNAVDIAEVFAELHELEAPQTALRLFRLLPKDCCGDVLYNGEAMCSRASSKHQR